jgi:drug/metabolite transporter (DMT)-like permease
MLSRRTEVREVWRRHRRELFGVAILAPGAYILVLAALTFTPASYVAPAREVSIAIGAALGIYLLKEGEASRRLPAAGLIVAGVVALALG